MTDPCLSSTEDTRTACSAPGLTRTDKYKGRELGKELVFQITNSQATKCRTNSKCVVNAAVCPLTIVMCRFSLEM